VDPLTPWSIAEASSFICLAVFSMFRASVYMSTADTRVVSMMSSPPSNVSSEPRQAVKCWHILSHIAAGMSLTCIFVVFYCVDNVLYP
jgi:hypothetical protein